MGRSVRLAVVRSPEPQSSRLARAGVCGVAVPKNATCGEFSGTPAPRSVALVPHRKNLRHLVRSKGTSRPNPLRILFPSHPTLPSGDSWGDTQTFRPRFARPLPPARREAIRPLPRAYWSRKSAQARGEFILKPRFPSWTASLMIYNEDPFQHWGGNRW